MPRILLFILCLRAVAVMAQPVEKGLFHRIADPEMPYNRFEKIQVLKAGPVFISATDFNFAVLIGEHLGAFTIGLDRQDYAIRDVESVFAGATIRAVAESSDRYIFFATEKNQISFFKSDLSGICDLPPFYWRPGIEKKHDIKELWFDRANTLYIGTAGDTLYLVPNAGNEGSLDPKNYTISHAADSAMNITRGLLPVERIAIGNCGGIYSFAENPTTSQLIWIGTGNGIYSFNKVTKRVTHHPHASERLTVTHLVNFSSGDIWFSTLEKGMGVFHQVSNSFELFPYPKKQANPATRFPVNRFCLQSPESMFIAIGDSLPAFFTVKDRQYQFIEDPLFTTKRNITSDIALDSSGNLLVTLDGQLFSGHTNDNPDWASFASIRY